jgi:hypothetical protein
MSFASDNTTDMDAQVTREAKLLALNHMLTTEAKGMETVIIGISSEKEELLEKYEAVLRQLREVQVQLAAAEVEQQELVDTRGQVAELREEVSRVRGELDVARVQGADRVTAAEEQLAHVSAKLAVAEGVAKDLNNRCEMMTVGYAGMKVELGGVRKELAGARWGNLLLLVLALAFAVLVSSSVKAGNVFDVATWPVEEAQAYAASTYKTLVQ